LIEPDWDPSVCQDRIGFDWQEASMQEHTAAKATSRMRSPISQVVSQQTLAGMSEGRSASGSGMAGA
jgi:hypothetical protein